MNAVEDQSGRGRGHGGRWAVSLAPAAAQQRGLVASSPGPGGGAAAG